MRAFSFALALSLAVFASACSSLDPIARPPAVTGEADFSSYVAIGTSISMGIQSAGLTEQYQRFSFPALLAAATGANGGTFVQPLVPDPGIPPVLDLVGFTIEGQPILQLRPGPQPSGPSTPRPADGYDNLGISGAVVANALTKTTGDEPTNYFDLVLQGQGTMLRQALAQRPTFVTVELGVNDALRAVLAGTDTELITSGEFQALYTQVMDSLAAGAPGARLALMNIPNVTDIPFATAIGLDVDLGAGPVRLKDAAGPLPDGARILLTAAALVASGAGLPGAAPPLPDSLVLTVAEVANIEAAVAAYNAVIAQQAQARGAALADANGLFARAHDSGILVAGTRYTTAFLSGGLFSRDGIHPSSLGHGLLANEFIRAINARFGGSIAPVDLLPLIGQQSDGTFFARQE
ncbi:MAG: SGNH/GDSL hydrolase family protein [Candidatus Eisenbacteria bacterium]